MRSRDRAAVALVASIAALVVACSKRDAVALEAPEAAAPPSTAPVSVVDAALAPPVPESPITLPPMRVDAKSACGSAPVPYCFVAAPNGCCGSAGVYATCGSRRLQGIGVWECPPGMTSGTSCPGADVGCSPAPRAAAEARAFLDAGALARDPNDIPAPYTIRSYSRRSGGFEGVAHLRGIFFGDELLTNDTQGFFAAPDGAALVYCADAKGFVHSPSSKAVAIGGRGCPTGAAFDLAGGKVTATLKGQPSITVPFR